jgi:NAD(P)-dependent dehydrogenase (short-subunit alcohol dehydrogenase family)
MATGVKAAIVTGAASGLGRAMALGLADHGIDVVAVDQNASALAALATAMAGKRGSVLTHPADLTRTDAFEGIAAAAQERFGRIDVLVNNAGIGQASVRADQRRNPIRFWEATPEQWSRFLAVNATAPIMMARAVVPHMLRARQGRIITVTTSLGTMVRAGYLLYGSSKAAAESATAVMAADLEGTGVTANVLVPGGVTNTPLVGTAVQIPATRTGGGACFLGISRAIGRLQDDTPWLLLSELRPSQTPGPLAGDQPALVGSYMARVATSTSRGR